jgi:membrane associated rhomboid family serine protease
VGAGPAISSLLTFYAMNNMSQTVLLFFFPVKMWILLSIVGFMALTDPSKKDLGGMIVGLVLSQIFRVRF